MITERLRQDASFMRVLTRAGGWKKAFLIDEVETQRMSATMLEAAERIEALEAELKSREGKPMTEQEIYYANY